WDKYQEDPASFFETKPRGCWAKTLSDGHKRHLINLLDDNLSTVIEEAVESLMKKFEGLKVSKTAVYNFTRKDGQFTFKKAQYYSIKRNDDEKIQKRYDWVMQWMNTVVDYLKNCDESGFHINMKRSNAWAAKGTTPVVKTSKTKATSLVLYLYMAFSRLKNEKLETGMGTENQNQNQR
ncbi:hypothetical protein DFQ28_002067, partial [Apophysomyces sp. BC1034]